MCPLHKPVPALVPLFPGRKVLLTSRALAEVPGRLCTMSVLNTVAELPVDLSGCSGSKAPMGQGQSFPAHL